MFQKSEQYLRTFNNKLIKENITNLFLFGFSIIVILATMNAIISYYICGILLVAFITIFICRHAHCKSDSDLVRKWSAKSHSGYGNLIFVMVGILWASAVSVFGSDIKSQIFTTSQSVSWETFFFFLTVYIAMIVGVYHYIGQQRKEKENQSRPPIKAIQLASKDIVDLNKALHVCMLDWAHINSTTSEITDQTIDDLDESLRSAKQLCLSSLLNVAMGWDEKNNDNVTYRANFFNLAPSEFVLQEFSKKDVIGPMPKTGGYAFNISSINQSPFFLFNDNWRARLEKCDFILVNEQELSVSLPVREKENTGCPICMPYSNIHENSTQEVKQPNIHGAPMAREVKRPVYIEDLKAQVGVTIKQLEMSPKYKDHVNERFKRDLNRYYENDSTGSVLSIPIFKFHFGSPYSSQGSIDDPIKDHDLVVCVVNIYVNKRFMFGNDDMANSYCDIMKPVIHVLAMLVSMRVSLIELKEMILSQNSGSLKAARTTETVATDATKTVETASTQTEPTKATETLDTGTEPTKATETVDTGTEATKVAEIVSSETEPTKATEAV
ncbi:hypothetical protein ABDZ57_15565 [Aeromonas veronii]|uniref:hypothetical protein n=1 Tax=Aeromonas veronii TaxID=654 RepID=UPI0031FCB1DA